MNTTLLSETYVAPNWEPEYQKIAADYTARFDHALANKRNPAGWQQSSKEIWDEVERQFPEAQHPALYRPLCAALPRSSTPFSAVVVRLRFPDDAK